MPSMTGVDGTCPEISNGSLWGRWALTTTMETVTNCRRPYYQRHLRYTNFTATALHDSSFVLNGTHQMHVQIWPAPFRVKGIVL